MGKIRFTSNKTKKIELEGGDWVEVREQLSFAEFGEIMQGKTKDEVGLDIAIPMLKKAIVNWNFKDEDGKDMPCTPENIDKLDMNTILELSGPISELYTPEKKSLK